MPSTPGDPHALDEEILELTDMIERGPGAPKEGDAGGSVDLSFERELEDLFSEPGDEGKPGDEDLPGLDGLDLPDEGPRAEGDDIDLDGLDALLAEAEKGASAETDLPELPDDYLSETMTASTAASGAAALADAFGEHSGTAAPAAGAVSSEAVDALNARLDGLEAQVADLPASLTATFQAMLGSAVADLKAESPAPADQHAGPASLIEEISTTLRDEMTAVRAEIAALPQLPDSQALAEEIRRQLAEMPQALDAPLSVEATADPTAMIEELSARLHAELDALRAEVGAEIAALAPAPVTDSQAMAEEIGQQLAADMPLADEAPAASVSMVQELSIRLHDELAALRTELGAEIAALRQAPENSDLATRQQLADAAETLRQELLIEIRKIIPTAAAQVIREEIQALLREED